MDRSCQTLLEHRRLEAEDSTSREDLGKKFFLPLIRQRRNLHHQDRLVALLLSTSFALPLLMKSVTSLEINGGSANPERSSCRCPARRPRHLLYLTRTDGERLPDSSANGHPVRAPHPHPGREAWKQVICGGASLFPGNTCAEKGGCCSAARSQPWGSPQHFPAAEDARLSTSLPNNH